MHHINLSANVAQSYTQEDHLNAREKRKEDNKIVELCWLAIGGNNDA